MPTRPTGTVTFLFTDIEGSTRHWEQHGAAMWAALARHEAVLRAHCAAHRGWVYKQIGDGFQVAFQTAPAALAAAVAIQCALHSDAWGQADPLRVRMALHTGETEERADDYVGPLLNRAARLLAAGHGGQLLLSAATYELVREALPAGVTLRDLGAQRLRDLVRPEHIWQAVVAGLPADFPLLRTLDARATNLPFPATPLVGRAPELGTVTALLRRPEVRLITLTGPGGIGKTRLALQVAADLLDAFPQGAVFISLAPVREPELVLTTIAHALGVAEHSDRPLRADVQDYLRDKELLLVLDNFEQVVTAAPLVADLLASAQRLKVLATSRTPLRLRGEHEVPVPPLQLPDRDAPLPLEQLAQYEAVRLFSERARAVRPDFAVTTASAPAVAEICRRLDGLPLAIELAAVHSKIFSPPVLLARLERRLPILTEGPRDLPLRQQTLRNAIAWSYDLLTPPEQALFRRLAVFASGWTLETAQQVCATAGQDEAAILALLTSLVNQSLVRVGERQGHPRYELLETLREYAWEQLEAAHEIAAVRAAHFHWYARLAEAALPHLRGPAQAAWADRLELEHDNLRAALAWCAQDTARAGAGLCLAGALGRFWLLRDYWHEGLRWVETMLAAESAASACRARALYAAGALSSDGDRARRWLEESVALWRRLDDRSGLAYALDELADKQRINHNLAGAVAAAEESRALLAGLGDAGGLAWSTFELGRIALRRNDLVQARRLLEQSRDLFRAAEEKGGQAWCLYQLGRVCLTQEDYPAARAALHASLALRRELGGAEGAAWTLNSLGELARLQGQLPEATAYYEESLAIHLHLNNKHGVAVARHNLGQLALVQGTYQQAYTQFRASLQLGQEIRGQFTTAEALAGLAAVAVHQGQPARAAQLLGATSALLDGIDAVLAVPDLRAFNQAQELTRQSLSEPAFTAAWTAGQRMSMHEAITFALDETPR
jgi:predicted ATPase/class 3 adenylate cyclase